MKGPITIEIPLSVKKPRKYLVEKRYRYTEYGNEPEAMVWRITPLKDVTIGYLNSLKKERRCTSKKHRLAYYIISDADLFVLLNKLEKQPDTHHWEEITEGHI